MATKSKSAMIEIPALQTEVIQVRIIGDSPLIMHKWSEKALKQMRDKQQKKATTAKEAKDPEADFRGSMYEHPDGGYGFPYIAFKAAAVRAANDAGVTMVLARRSFQVPHGLVKIESDDPVMREDTVVVGRGVADLRYRGEFNNWSAVLQVKYNKSIITAEQVVNLINIAGFGVGVGEWRPERNGIHGTFHVEGLESA